ncbi:MAG: hypothetical protein HDS36_00930 [Bacteroides sp.]|nr:hypothetical protein [Bacteroides sp.]
MEKSSLPRPGSGQPSAKKLDILKLITALISIIASFLPKKKKEEKKEQK